MNHCSSESDHENSEMDNSSSDSDNGKTACWYGSSCYRRNPDHRRLFSHPKKTRINISDRRNRPSRLDTTTNIEEKVVVKVVVGHYSCNKGQEPFKYWTAFIKGVEGKEIEHFIEKVVFHLPESFSIPIRVVEKAPFQLSESSMKSFEISIDLYFKCYQQRKKTITHSLALVPDRPVNVINVEKLIFLNTTLDFRQKVLNAGGEVVPASVQADSSRNVNRKNDLHSHSSIKRKRNDSIPAASEANAFSKMCAVKLLKIGHQYPTQKIIAEKLIADVLYRAQLNMLSTNSCITPSKDSRQEIQMSLDSTESDYEPQTSTRNCNVKVEPGTATSGDEKDSDLGMTHIKTEPGISTSNIEMDDEIEIINFKPHFTNIQPETAKIEPGTLRSSNAVSWEPETIRIKVEPEIGVSDIETEEEPETTILESTRN